MKQRQNIAVCVPQRMGKFGGMTAHQMRKKIQRAVIERAMLQARKRHDTQLVVAASLAARPQMRRVARPLTGDDAAGVTDLRSLRRRS